MSRYSVDLDQLLDFVDRLEQFDRRAEEIAAAVDQEVVQLHGTWLGIGADAQKDYHETWLRLTREMRKAAEFLRSSAELAHRNYTGAAETNRGMWP